MNSPRFVDMRYALNSGVGMRQAYPIMRPAWGATAMLLLRRYLDVSSMDMLEQILICYNESIVELAAYKISVGLFQWNTLFWEVRNY